MSLYSIRVNDSSRGLASLSIEVNEWKMPTEALIKMITDRLGDTPYKVDASMDTVTIDWCDGFEHIAPSMGACFKHLTEAYKGD